MTIAEMMELLKAYPADMVVYISSDAEGNHYSPVATIDQSMVRDSDGEIECWSEENLSEEGEEVEEFEKAVFIWPE